MRFKLDLELKNEKNDELPQVICILLVLALIAVVIILLL